MSDQGIAQAICDIGLLQPEIDEPDGFGKISQHLAAADILRQADIQILDSVVDVHMDAPLLTLPFRTWQRQ